MTSQSTENTLLELLERGAPSHRAIRVPGGPSVTYESLRRQVHALAGQLAGLGICRGDRVAIVLPNGIEALVCFLAVSAATTAAPLNQAYKLEEFRFYLEDTKAKALITAPAGGEEARKAAPSATLQIEISVDAQGEVALSTAAEAAAYDPPGPDDVALVLHTSGTTSRPKRVPLTHGNLSASVRNVVDTYRLTPADASLCVMPLFHVHGLVASTLATFLSGGTLVLPARFNALNFWPVVRDYGVTWYSAVPTMHQTLLNRAKSRGADDSGGAAYGHLRFIRSCSAHLPPSTMLEMEEVFGVPVIEAYGMTEASHQMASNPLAPGVRVPGSVGQGTGVAIAIMNEEDALLPMAAKGEVVIQGPNVISAYEDNPDANADSFTNGWFRTGDEGSLDADGYLTLSGRLKELINRSGEKISPLEIDEVLRSHPAVAEAVSFGVPHPTHGEEPSAAVVLSGEATAQELIAHCRSLLADFKCPRVVHIVDEIPRTATGKVQRRLVAEAIATQTAKPS